MGTSTRFSGWRSRVARLSGDACVSSTNQHLAQRNWLELDRPTIADIACFPYIAMAEDGKISLVEYPHIVNWIDRVKQLPGYIELPSR